MNTVGINKFDILEMVKGCVNLLLTEDQAAKSIAGAIKFLMAKGISHENADEFVRINVRGKFPILRTDTGAKFILGVTRLLMNNEVGTPEREAKLASILRVVASENHINELDRNLNGLSLTQLIDMFEDETQDEAEKEREEINSMEFNGPSNYQIVKINNYFDAEKYNQYTTWCVTSDREAFDHYTRYGIYQFYFCLKNGYEQVVRKKGENCPLDEYGLSMLAVCVNERGGLETCTCRWNHDNGGDDRVMGVKDISNVIGMNFFNVFKPNSKFELELDRVKKILSNTYDRREISLGSLFMEVGDTDEGLTPVCLKGRWNYLKEDLTFLSDVWYDFADRFHCGAGIVKKDGRENYIDKNGNIVLKKWYTTVYEIDRQTGFGIVSRVAENNEFKYNYINLQGKVLLNEWVDNAWDFVDGVARIYIENSGYNLINTKGDILSKMPFDYMAYPHCGLLRVSNLFPIGNDNSGRREHLYNFIDLNGNVKFKTWFREATNYDNNIASVMFVENGESYGYYIDTEGNVLGVLPWCNNEQDHSKIE